MGAACAAVGVRSAMAEIADKTVWPGADWETATPASQGMSEAGLGKLREYLEGTGTRAALVVRNGRIVGEWYWESASAETQFPVYSVTKSFTATAVGMLASAGKLKLDQPAADFIPEWKDDGRKAITIRHLLAMTSGILKKEPEFFGQPDQVAFAIAQPLKDAPGTRWDYSQVGLSPISRVIRAAAGVEMADYLKEKLYAPLGITHYTHAASAGHTLPYSGLAITARDLARFGYLYLHEGRWKGKELVPAAFIREATTASQELEKAYGLLWWVNTHGQWNGLPRNAHAALGLYGNHLLVLPEKRLLVIRLVGTKEKADSDLSKMGTLALATCV